MKTPTDCAVIINRTMAVRPSKSGSMRRDPLLRRMRRFNTDNGLYLTARYAANRAVGLLRSRLTASSLGSPRGFWIGTDAVILGAARISVGYGFVAGSHLWLEAISLHRGVEYRPAIEIGNNVTLGDFVRMSANTRIHIGSKIYIADHNHGNYDDDAPSDPRESPHSRPLSSGEPVTVGDRAWIGESVTILPGASVGEGSIIGANSVVASTIPSFAVAAGSPARVIKQFDVTTKRWQRVNPTDTARR